MLFHCAEHRTLKATPSVARGDNKLKLMSINVDEGDSKTNDVHKLSLEYVDVMNAFHLPLSLRMNEILIASVGVISIKVSSKTNDEKIYSYLLNELE